MISTASPFGGRTDIRIRPQARLGHYTGDIKDPDAEVVFASIQTLSRREHLERFAPDAFDYLVVDEFHHAAAASYGKLIAYFRPKFLLGLTAPPVQDRRRRQSAGGSADGGRRDLPPGRDRLRRHEHLGPGRRVPAR
jgi:hypothetical protein